MRLSVEGIAVPLGQTASQHQIKRAVGSRQPGGADSEDEPGDDGGDGVAPGFDEPSRDLVQGTGGERGDGVGGN